MLRLAPFVNVKEIHLSSRVLPPEKAPPSGLSATFSPEGEKGLRFTLQIAVTKQPR
jgi:hypothetical protein